MKSVPVIDASLIFASPPSMRREWIEIRIYIGRKVDGMQGPPCGGSGLKSVDCIPPPSALASPSMRREWIEIKNHDMEV